MTDSGSEFNESLNESKENMTEELKENEAQESRPRKVINKRKNKSLIKSTTEFTEKNILEVENSLTENSDNELHGLNESKENMTDKLNESEAQENWLRKSRVQKRTAYTVSNKRLLILNTATKKRSVKLPFLTLVGHTSVESRNGHTG